MPFSTPVFADRLQKLIDEVKPSEVVDVGVGSGQAALLNYPVGCTLYGYEMERTYESRFPNTYGVYMGVIFRDFYDFVIGGTALWDVTADIFIFGDVLEHIPSSRVIDILDYCTYRSKYIFITSPVDYIQGPVQGALSERHISNVRLSDMIRFNIVEYAKRPFKDGNGTFDMQMFIIKGLRK